MADSPIGSLPQAGAIGNTDKFLLEQEGVAKYILGSLLTEFINRNVLDVQVTTLSPESSTTVDYNPTTGTLTLGIPKGEEGTSAILNSSEIVYQQSDSGSTIPTGDWSTEVPPARAGYYIWSRTTLYFNTGLPVTYYSVARSGLDGLGSVSYINNISPDASGNITLTASDVNAVPTSRTINGEALSANVTTRLSFTNSIVAVSSWTDDNSRSWSADYPKRGVISGLTGVQSTMFADVILYPEDALSGIYAPIAETGTNCVYIWATEVPESDLSVPTVFVIK